MVTINSMVPRKKQAKTSRLIEIKDKMKQAATTMGTPDVSLHGTVVEVQSQHDFNVTTNIRP